MKIKTTLFAIILSTISIFAQPDKKNTSEFTTYHKNIYVEGWGSHLLVGINFDMRLTKGQMDGLGFRIGIGGFQEKSRWDYTREIRYYYNPDDFFGKDFSNYPLGLTTIPIEINYLIGRKRSSFVAGIGMIPVFAVINGTRYTDFNDFVQKKSVGVIGSFINIGYRFQPIKKGIMFQINWNPMLIKNKGFDPAWIGIGIGIGFK